MALSSDYHEAHFLSHTLGHSLLTSGPLLITVTLFCMPFLPSPLGLRAVQEQPLHSLFQWSQLSHRCPQLPPVSRLTPVLMPMTVPTAPTRALPRDTPVSTLSPICWAHKYYELC